MIYYAIRHKASGQLMPQMKRGRGYSHWNPSNPDPEKKVYAIMPTPRLIDTRKRAMACLAQWAAMPNAKYFGHTDFETGYKEYDLATKRDGRKKEDLEVVKVELRIR